jgi:hypothetical protein
VRQPVLTLPLREPPGGATPLTMLHPLGKGAYWGSLKLVLNVTSLVPAHSPCPSLMQICAYSRTSISGSKIITLKASGHRLYPLNVADSAYGMSQNALEDFPRIGYTLLKAVSLIEFRLCILRIHKTKFPATTQVQQ